MSRMIQHKFKFYKILQVVLALLLMLSCDTDPMSATSARAANSYHVATTGNDANPGTQAAPFQTIQKAVTAAKPGDVVYVHAGSYSAIRIYPAGGIGSSGQPGNPIVYRAYGDGTVTIDGGSGAAIWIEGAYLEFEGFRITAPLRNGTWGGIGVFLNDDGPAGSQTMITHHVIVRNCEIVNCAHHGVLGRCNDSEFSALDVHHNGKYWFGNQGFYLAGSRNRIVRNKIHDNAATGIQLWHTSPDPTRVPNHTVVADNMIYANGFTGETNDPNYPERSQYGRGIVLGSNGAAGEGNIIQNNLIFANFPYGIDLSSLGANTKILNNTIVGNVIGIGAVDEATGVILENNIVYGNSASAIREWLQVNRPELLASVNPNRHGSGLNINTTMVNGGGAFDGYTLDYNIWDPAFPFVWKGVKHGSFSAYQSASGKDAHSLAIDPKFQNFISDFHLQSNSPAIDAGIAVPEVTSDIEGKPRPQGSRFDIGAYESGGGGAMSTTINASPTSGSIPLTVNFNGSAYGGTPPYSYSWDFGNGSSSIQQNPQHIFATAGSHVVKLTATDAKGIKATGAATIVAADLAAASPSVVDVKFANIGQTAALTTIEADSWYELYLLLNDPQGWNNLSYADVWISHTSNTLGKVGNRGGDYFAASNYVLSFSITDSTIWAKETEGTSTWANLTGKLGLYVDDNANECRQNGTQKWAKARIKLLSTATPGTWQLNAFVWDRDQHQSVLMTETVNVDPKDPAPTASIRANGPFPQQDGTYRVTLTTSSPVVKIPTVLLFIDSGGTTSTIPLTGEVPGSSFRGQLVKGPDLKEGNGCFALTPGALVDQAGHEGNNIVKGKIIKIDWPPSVPQNITVKP